MDKATQRARGIAARKAIPVASRAAYTAAIVARIESSEAFLRAKTVLSYRGAGGEVDISSLQSYGKIIAYPVCLNKTAMCACIPGNAALVRGMYGIEEPDRTKAAILQPTDIDLVLVPCAAFDDQGHRIGMGGGYYDRYLPACTRAVKMLVAFEAQNMQAVDRGAHDVRMDVIVTERRLCRCEEDW